MARRMTNEAEDLGLSSLGLRWNTQCKRGCPKGETVYTPYRFTEKSRAAAQGRTLVAYCGACYREAPIHIKGRSTIIEVQPCHEVLALAILGTYIDRVGPPESWAEVEDWLIEHGAPWDVASFWASLTAFWIKELQ